MAKSATDPKPTGAKRKVKKSKPQSIYISYIVEINKFDFGYWLNLGNPRFHEGPYNEMAHLKLFGTVHRPVDPKYPRSATIMISGDDRMLNEIDYEPKSIGYLAVREDLLDIYIPVPKQRLDLIYGCLRNGGKIICQMIGTRIRYRTASIISFHVSADLEEENW